MKSTEVIKPDKPERFKNRREALSWLQARGQISRSKFYDDCSSGVITIYPDKTVSMFDVALYAEKHFTPARNSLVSGDMSRERERLEIEKLRLEVSKLEIETRRDDDKWILKEEAYTQMAAIFGVLRDALRHQFYSGAATIVQACGGEQKRVMELYELCEEIIGRGFNQVADMGRIQGVFVRAEEIQGE